MRQSFTVLIRHRHYRRQIDLGESIGVGGIWKVAGFNQRLRHKYRHQKIRKKTQSHTALSAFEVSISMRGVL
jgi:hypothetical protein